VQSARLELGYTRVRSPIAGRTGAVLVQPGNVVKAADATPLVVINRVDPIYVSFAVPDPRLAQIQRAQRVRPLPVEAVIAGDEAAPPTGRVSFVDNQVDAQTGTIRLKATFPNPSGRLWPGRFVRARLTLGTQVGAVVIPAAAVQAGQQGSTVFVMKPDQTVEQRGVVAHPAGEGQVVVDRGVAAGESVVVDGQLGLTNGAKVQPRAASGAGQ
jgi:multidrug efflux system membrane fusion protein